MQKTSEIFCNPHPSFFNAKKIVWQFSQVKLPRKDGLVVNKSSESFVIDKQQIHYQTISDVKFLMSSNQHQIIHYSDSWYIHLISSPHIVACCQQYAYMYNVNIVGCSIFQPTFTEHPTIKITTSHHWVDSLVRLMENYAIHQGSILAVACPN